MTFAVEGDERPVWAVGTALASHSPALRDRARQVDKKDLREKGESILLGLELDRAAGVLAGTPVVAGSYVLNVQAAWEYGRIADTRTYILTIDP